MNWYTIQNKHKDSAEILLYDVIGKGFFGDGISAKEFAEEVSSLDVKIINVRINSPGGQLFEGISIYNALRSHPATINVAIDSIAASIASVIAMAGDKITMAENAMMMIHNPMGMSIGDAEQHRHMADMQDKAKHLMVKTYQKQVDLDDEELSAMMSDETWMTANEAMDNGFIHEVTGALKIAASCDKNLFASYKHVPEALVDTKKPAESKQTVQIVLDSTQILEALGNITEQSKLIANKTDKEKGRSVAHLSKEIELLEID